MSIILSVDESSLDQAGTQDTTPALPTKLNSDLTTIFGGAPTVLEVAVTSNALTFGANTQTVLFTNSSGVELNGVDSGLVAIDGRQISLYTYGPDNNLVIGREDNADGSANASGTPVFAIYLDTNGSAGDENFDLGATSANLWVVEFSSIQHYLNTSTSNTAYNDFNDIVTLANKLFVTSSNPVSFNADHSPSGSNLFITFGDGSPAATETSVIATAVGAANQSVTGGISGGAVVKTSQAGPDATFGVDSQMFDPPSASKPTAEAMYFTFVKGVVPGLTVPNLSPGEADLESNIQFSNYVGTTSISFSIAQLQPSSSKATMEIYALVANPNGANGAGIADDGVWSGNSYIDHQDDNTSVNITSITVTRNGTPIVFNASATTSGITVNFSPGDDANAATISGLLAGDKVTYTSASEHDRLEIKNIGSVDPALNASFDIGGLTMVTGGTATSALPDIQFYDDGPVLTPQAIPADNNLFVDNDLSTPADSTDTSSYGLLAGSDGQKSYSIVGPEDTSGTFRWHYTTAGDPTAITGTFVDANSVSHNLYTLALNSSTGAYTFTMTGSLPPTAEGLSSTIIHAGGPANLVDVQAEAPSTDFGRIVASSTVGNGLVNASHGFVGVDNGNLDPNETLNLSLHESNGDLILLSGVTIGTKSAQTSHYDYFITLSDDSVVQVGNDVAVLKGGTITVLDNDPNDSLLIKSVTVTMVDGNAIKIGLGDIDFLVPPNDVQLGFTVRLTDGDNDFTDQSFTVDIDGNNDGNYDATTNALSVPLSTDTFSAIQPLQYQPPQDYFMM
jgi:hypothetical protein